MVRATDRMVSSVNAAKPRMEAATRARLRPASATRVLNVRSSAPMLTSISANCASIELVRREKNSAGGRLRDSGLRTCSSTSLMASDSALCDCV